MFSYALIVCSLIPGLSRLPQQKFSDQTSQQSQTLSFNPEQERTNQSKAIKADRQQLDQLIDQIN